MPDRMDLWHSPVTHRWLWRCRVCPGPPYPCAAHRLWAVAVLTGAWHQLADRRAGRG